MIYKNKEHIKYVCVGNGKSLLLDSHMYNGQAAIKKIYNGDRLVWQVPWDEINNESVDKYDKCTISWSGGSSINITYYVNKRYLTRNYTESQFQASYSSTMNYMFKDNKSLRKLEIQDADFNTTMPSYYYQHVFDGCMNLGILVLRNCSFDSDYIKLALTNATGKVWVSAPVDNARAWRFIPKPTS